VIRFLPPIDVTSEEIARGVDMFRTALQSIPRAD
jgi:acetylornithine/succinyldiaminopimelate/putrescine aminotransferase